MAHGFVSRFSDNLIKVLIYLVLVNAPIFCWRVLKSIRAISHDYMSRYHYILKLTKDKCELKVNIHFLIILSTTHSTLLMLMYKSNFYIYFQVTPRNPIHVLKCMFHVTFLKSNLLRRLL